MMWKLRCENRSFFYLKEDPYEGGPLYDGPFICLNETPGSGSLSVPCF